MLEMPCWRDGVVWDCDIDCVCLLGCPAILFVLGLGVSDPPVLDVYRETAVLFPVPPILQSLRGVGLHDLVAAATELALGLVEGFVPDVLGVVRGARPAVRGCKAKHDDGCGVDRA